MTLALALLFLAGCISAPKWIDRLNFAVSVAICVAVAVWVSPLKAAPTQVQSSEPSATLSTGLDRASFMAGRFVDLYHKERDKR